MKRVKWKISGSEIWKTDHVKGERNAFYFRKKVCPDDTHWSPFTYRTQWIHGEYTPWGTYINKNSYPDSPTVKVIVNSLKKIKKIYCWDKEPLCTECKARGVTSVNTRRFIRHLYCVQTFGSSSWQSGAERVTTCYFHDIHEVIRSTWGCKSFLFNHCRVRRP